MGKGGNGMRVEVSESLCVGHGECELVAPQLFRVEKDGLSHFIGTEIGVESLSMIERAIDACPEQAIVLDQGE
jgi:ferredoxin